MMLEEGLGDLTPYDCPTGGDISQAAWDTPGEVQDT